MNMSIVKKIRVLTGVIACGVTVMAIADCFIEVPTGTSCDAVGFTLTPPVVCGGGMCGDFFNSNPNMNNFSKGTNGKREVGLVNVTCMVQRKICGAPPGGGAPVCLANGVYSKSTQTMGTFGATCTGGGGGK